jgi:hypothetical protein
MAINTQHSDKWSVIFSNIPGYTPPISGNNLDNMSLYDSYVKDVTFPDLGVELAKSNFRNYEINHPISKINDNTSEISISFKLSEGMLNYFYLYNWVRGLREQDNVNNEMWFRLNCIKEIKIIFLDNQKRNKLKYTVENAFITNLGSLSLTNGSDDELSFTISLTYEDFRLEKYDAC